MKRLYLMHLLFLLLPFCMRAAENSDAVCLTFSRTGTDAAGVTVSVTNQDGTAIASVTATLESMSFAALKTAGATAITGGTVLAPDSYANAANSQISYLFRISGLSDSFTFNSVDVDVYALTAGGTAQNNGGNTVRFFRFAVAAGASTDVSTFARKDVDTDICTVSDQMNGLYHSVQTMTADEPAAASDPLYVQVTLTKTSELGCYAGIGMVKLYTAGTGGGEEPVEPEDKGFSADKFYTIHRNGNTSAYIYQNGSTMGAAQLDNTKPFWWVLEPTANEDCYYIKNVTTGQYVQSAVQTLSSLVPMGNSPVEFQIKKDQTAGAATNGYYYIASTDQDISVATDGSLGLNFGATGIVAYYIRSGRGNSYWQIEEGEYAYEAPGVKVTDFSRAIQLYSIPCGTAVSSYLSKLDIAGDDVLSELHYSVTAAPASYYTLYVAQKADVVQGGQMSLALAIANENSEIRTFAYADWDKDGVFEESVEVTDGNSTFEVPSTTAEGQYRIRIRITETDTKGAEDDVIGACYDFIVNVVSADAVVMWSVDVNDQTRGKAAAEVVDDILHLEASPLGDAKFLGWKLMHSYFIGEYISSELTYEYPLTQSVRIVAVFTPNTQPVPVSLSDLRERSQNDALLFDVAGRKVSPTTKGIIISQGKKRISK